MFATGSQVRGWLLIEVRGSWGEDAIHTSALGDVAPAHWKDELKERHIRAVCIRSHLRPTGDDLRIFSCVPARPGSTESAAFWSRDVGSFAEVITIAADLHVDRVPAGDWEMVPEPLVLVCTNGRHDQCCANQGRPLVRALRESKWADRVWECSHIGGDRFAANVVVLPESLYFGRVAPEAGAALLTGLDEGRLDLDLFRGRTTYSLAEQAVEHFVRDELGIVELDDVVVGRRSADGSFPVRAAADVVHVRVRQHLVSVAEPLTCKGRAGQLVPQFELESIL
jgi:hypothetical protein